MAFVGIEFDNNEVAVVHASWLSPLKKNVQWPPYKGSKNLNKALSCGEVPDGNTWTTYPVQRTFFAYDNLEKSLKKLQQCETLSDVLTSDTENQPRKRTRKAKRLSSSDEEEPISNLRRPPLQNISFSTPRRSAYDSTSSRLVVGSISHAAVSAPSNVSQPGSSIVSGHLDCDNDATFLDGDNATNKKLLKMVVLVKRQNEQILKQNEEILQVLKTKQGLFEGATHQLPQLPVNLPTRNLDEITLLEEYLLEDSNFTALSLYLSTLGGRDVTTKTNSILRSILANEIAIGFSFLGTRNNKKSFSQLKLYKLVIRAVQVSSPNTSEADINNNIKVWLKHSPQRLSLERKRDTTD